MSILQGAHKLQVKITRIYEGREGRAFVGTLSEERAIEMAGKIVSEGFLLAVRS